MSRDVPFVVPLAESDFVRTICVCIFVLQRVVINHTVTLGPTAASMQGPLGDPGTSRVTKPSVFDTER